MTPNQDLFTVLNQECRSKVRVGNGEVLEAHDKGTILMDTHQGTKLIFDVLYVPKLAVNLLSVPQLLENKFILHFEDKECLISDSKGLELF